MLWRPAVVVHELAQARAALRPGYAVLLLSAPDAAGFAGCLWWRSMVALARAAHPATPALDLLDCGAAPGWAMASLRAGQRLIRLDPACPGFAAVRAAAATLGADVLPNRPDALDMADSRAAWRLTGWLAGVAR